MKGSPHTDELMAAVVKRDLGLRARRVATLVMDVPGHEQALIITDAAVNIAPTLEDKVHIQTRSTSRTRWVCRKYGWPFSRRWKPSTRRCPPRSKPLRCAR